MTTTDLSYREALKLEALEEILRILSSNPRANAIRERISRELAGETKAEVVK